MQLVTVGTKNQIVLPKEVRTKIKGLKPGSKVMVYLISSNTIAIKAETQDWIERTHQIAKELWKNIDPIQELEKMRDEWQ